MGYKNSITDINSKVGINQPVPAEALDVIGNAIVTGNVGIGTTSPDEKLDITGGYLKFNGGDYGIKGSASLTYNPVSDHYFMSSGSTKVTIKASGNVGIGYSTPSDFTSVGADNLVIGPLSGNNGVTVNSATTGYGALAFADGTGASDQYRGLVQYNHTTDSLALFTNATTKMTILSGGNVGIGTDSPGEKLSVSGNIELDDMPANGARWLLTNETNTGTGRLSIQAGGGSASFGGGLSLFANAHATKPGWITAGISAGSGTDGTASEGRFTVNNQGIGGGTDIFTVLRTGNVGIGTTSPVAKLEINGIADDTNGLLQVENTVSSTGATANSQFIVKNVNMVGQFMAWEDDGMRIGTRSSAVGDGNVHFTTNDAVKMTILGSNGNVGIGTTSPGAYKLNVSGTGYYSGQLTVDGFTNDSGISFRDGYDPTNAGIRAKAVGTANRDGLELLGYNGIDFTVNNGANIAMRIVGVTGSGMGNVGIGTTSPSKKLDVQVAGGDGIRVSNSTNPGYYSDLLLNLNDISTMQLTCLGTSILQAGNTGNTVLASRTNKDIILSPNGTGNVGIGTTGPAAKLDVAGIIRSKGNNNYENILTKEGSTGSFTFSSTELGAGIVDNVSYFIFVSVYRPTTDVANDVGTLLLHGIMPRGGNSVFNTINTLKGSGIAVLTATNSGNSLVITTDSNVNLRCAIKLISIGGTS